MEHELPLIAERRGEDLLLLSPSVGTFTCARRRGDVLSVGADAGVLVTLGRAQRLVVPEGVQGRIRNERPERVREPVGYRSTLYELAPIGLTADLTPEVERSTDDSAALSFRSPQSGRFYQRPSPDAAHFVSPGDLIEEGAAIGLIEVMKTFAHVIYRAGSTLPPRARVLRLLVTDGAEVAEGAPLLELEPA